MKVLGFRFPRTNSEVTEAVLYIQQRRDTKSYVTNSRFLCRGRHGNACSNTTYVYVTMALQEEHWSSDYIAVDCI